MQAAFHTHLGPLVHGILAAVDDDPPGLLLRLPVCLLVDAADAVDAAAAVSGPFAAACADAVLPTLLKHLTVPDITVAAVFGLGVCARAGTPAAIDPLLGQVLTVLLACVGADAKTFRALAVDEEEVDMDELRGNALSSLLKVCLYPYLGLSPTSFLSRLSLSVWLGGGISSFSCLSTYTTPAGGGVSRRGAGSQGASQTLSSPTQLPLSLAPDPTPPPALPRSPPLLL